MVCQNGYIQTKVDILWVGTCVQCDTTQNHWKFSTFSVVWCWAVPPLGCSVRVRLDRGPITALVGGSPEKRHMNEPSTQCKKLLHGFLITMTKCTVLPLRKARRYLRNRPMRRKRIQDAWVSTPLRVMEIQGTTYTVETVDRGPVLNVNRVDIRY